MSGDHHINKIKIRTGDLFNMKHCIKAGIIFVSSGITFAESVVLEEVIVTATKRSQTIQEVSAAVTAVQSEFMMERGIIDLADMQNYVPSARIQTQASSIEIHIRGIGSTNDYANTEPPVSFNINGVYTPREGASSPLFDLARIEVLPGPQGALYGRSAIGGAVNIEFQRPTNELETKFLAEAGNYDMFHGTVIQNVPVNENLAIRAAVDYRSRDGYFETGGQSADDIAARISALFTPDDNFSAYLWAFATKKKGDSQNFVNKDENGTINNDPWDDSLPQEVVDSSPLFSQPRAVPRDYSNAAIGGTFEWQVGEITITNIIGYVEADMDQSYYLGALLGTYNADIEAYSNELRISGETTNMTWLTGLSLYRQKNSDVSGLAPLFLNFNDGNESEGLGLYAYLTYDVSEDMRAIIAGRYSSDSRKGRGRTTADPGGPDNFATVPWTADVDSDQVDWKVGLEYDAADDVMVYANVQTGYQPATYNATPNTDTFNNETEAPTILAYTAGIKSMLLDGKLQLNSEAFYYEYDDLPLQGTDLSLLFNPLFNAKSVEVSGIELDAAYRPSSQDQIALSLGYLDAEQTEAVGPDNPAFGVFAGVDVSGKQLQNAPSWTATLSYSRDFVLESGY
ncbi:TonB-dependent receptor, partial [gamma proteobacterium BDW918]